MKPSKISLLIFTNNKFKLDEFKKIFPIKNYKVYTLCDFKKIIKPKEIGKTFRENAIIKSKFGFRILKLPCIAEDSGICIDALGGGPGIKSNRYQKIHGGFKKTNNKIIKIVKRKNMSGATFISVIALTYKNKTLTFTGKKRGRIVKKPIGDSGFHYDPIFQPLKNNKTYGQMKKNEKNIISHRNIAIKKLTKFLSKISQLK